jgi:hypothetical protein
MGSKFGADSQRVLEAALDRDAYSTMVRAVAAATARG